MARKMKDSGIAWIGDIPEGWEITKIKYGVIKVGSGKTPSGGAEVYTDSGVLFLRSQNVYDCALVLDNPTYISYETDATMKSTRVLPNDVLLNITGASIGRCCVVPETLGAANVNQHVCIIRTDSSFFLPKFMQYFWVSHLGRYAISLFQTGGNREGLSFDAIRSTPIPYLSISEQSKIVTYLDSECSRIDAMLTKTHASIEEYKKLKQAVITQAVTKGVRGEREMKDSGSPWLGQIPADWKISRVGLHFSIILGKMLCNSQPDDSYTLEPYYCAADVHFDGVAAGERKKMWFNPAEKELYHVTVGDLLVVEGGAGAGGCAIVTQQESNTYVQNSIMIVRSKGNSDNRYLRYLLESLVKQGYIDIVCNKATIPHFTKDKLSCVPFCVCQLNEQQEIADYLDAKCAEIDRLIAKKEQLVKELEGYKKSLIYEVVTGKREV